MTGGGRRFSTRGFARLPDAPPAAPLEFWSADGRNGMSVGAACVGEILRTCADAGRRETGGILVGSYRSVGGSALDCAVVSDASGPPEDSRAGTTWFERGVRGLQRLLDDRWRRGNFYLGEWHFHPFAGTTPSRQDLESLAGIASNPQYRCPEPVVLIVGGDPSGAWRSSAFVFLGERGLVSLHRGPRSRRETGPPETR